MRDIETLMEKKAKVEKMRLKKEIEAGANAKHRETKKREKRARENHQMEERQEGEGRARA